MKTEKISDSGVFFKWYPIRLFNTIPILEILQQKKGLSRDIKDLNFEFKNCKNKKLKNVRIWHTY